jgi:hypothetical protein
MNVYSLGCMVIQKDKFDGGCQHDGLPRRRSICGVDGNDIALTSAYFSLSCISVCEKEKNGSLNGDDIIDLSVSLACVPSKQTALAFLGYAKRKSLISA